MGPVLHLLLALVTLALPELGWASGTPRPWAVALLVLAPIVLGAAVRNSLLRGRFRLGAALERVLVHGSPIAQALAIGLFGWIESVAGWTGWRPGLADWPGLELLLGIVPFLAVELVAIDAHARLMDPRPEVRGHLRAFQIRLLCSALVPFVGYLGLSNLIALHEPLRVHLEEVALHGAAFTTVVLVGLVVVLPTLLRGTWDTAPLEPGWIRTLLEDLARRADFRCRELLVWRTGGRMANAAIVGFTPRSRVVLLSDALLAQLQPREIAAVFAHEMGHALRHHALVFACWALAFLLGADLVITATGVDEALAVIGIFAGALVTWYLSFGFLSRRFELEADLVSLELLGDAAPLVHALREVTGAHAHRRSSWRHFSTAQRIAFLARAEADAAVGHRLRKRLRLASVLGALLFASAAALEMREMWIGMDEERAVAELRLGRYVDAAQRVQRVEEPDEVLVALVELAASLEPADRTPRGLETAALEAAAAGDLDRAAGLIELALLRGRAELEPVAEVLDALREEAEGAGADELPEAWRTALRP